MFYEVMVFKNQYINQYSKKKTLKALEKGLLAVL